MIKTGNLKEQLSEKARPYSELKKLTRGGHKLEQLYTSAITSWYVLANSKMAFQLLQRFIYEQKGRKRDPMRNCSHLHLYLLVHDISRPEGPLWPDRNHCCWWKIDIENQNPIIRISWASSNSWKDNTHGPQCGKMGHNHRGKQKGLESSSFFLFFRK